ncbi:MAG: PDZ domain-containing protein, partial [Corynebacterium sp.]|nr:PDZ domain-containing protein [Corynebacterium sp.]
SAAFDNFDAGDTLTAVNGTPVTTPGQVQEMIRNMAPGDEVNIDYLRGGEEETATVVLGEHPQDPQVPLLGISMTSVPTSDTEVSYNLKDIGGPSAGLMFSLAVVDKLSPGPLNGGKFVAGSGTISEDGSVGPIGGIAHKVRAAEEAGAEIFLAPTDNCAEALTADRGDMTILKVDTLEHAIEQMDAFNFGGDFETCS